NVKAAQSRSLRNATKPTPDEDALDTVLSAILRPNSTPDMSAVDPSWGYGGPPTSLSAEAKEARDYLQTTHQKALLKNTKGAASGSPEATAADLFGQRDLVGTFPLELPAGKRPDGAFGGYLAKIGGTPATASSGDPAPDFAALQQKFKRGL